MAEIKDSGVAEAVCEEIISDNIENIQPEIDEINAKIYNCSFAFLRRNQEIMKKFATTTDMHNRLETLRQNLRYASSDPSRVSPAVIQYYTFFKSYMSAYSSTQEQKKELYENIITYQKEINEILGQTVKMTFVFEDNAEIIFIDSENLIANEWNSVKGKFKYNLRLYDSTSMNSETYDTSNLNFIPLKNTYLEIIWRYDIAQYRKRTTGTTGRNTGPMKMILYYIGNHWYGVRVSSKGDISEAYATYALSHTLKPFIEREGNIEEQVQYFLFGVDNGTSFYRHQTPSYISKWSHGGVIGIDNEPGFLAGDFSKDGIEYGIKGNAAMTLGIKQVFDFAENVVNQHGAYSITDIQTWKNNARNNANTRNKMTTNVRRTLHDKITDAVSGAQLDRDLRAAKTAIAARHPNLHYNI